MVRRPTRDRHWGILMLAMLGSQWIRAAAAAAAVFIASFSPASLAQDAEPEADAGPRPSGRQPSPRWCAARTRVQLKDQAQLALPAGYGFVPPKEGAAVMDMLGNQTDERFVGLIFPAGRGLELVRDRRLRALRLHQGRRRQGMGRRRAAAEPEGRHRGGERASPRHRRRGDPGDALGREARVRRADASPGVVGRSARERRPGRPTRSSTTTPTCWAAKATSR